MIEAFLRFNRQAVFSARVVVTFGGKILLPGLGEADSGGLQIDCMAQTLHGMSVLLEHRMGFEPMSTGFADQRVNHFAIGAHRCQLSHQARHTRSGLSALFIGV